MSILQRRLQRRILHTQHKARSDMLSLLLLWKYNEFVFKYGFCRHKVRRLLEGYYVPHADDLFRYANEDRRPHTDSLLQDLPVPEQEYTHVDLRDQCLECSCERFQKGHLAIKKENMRSVPQLCISGKDIL
ncbi:unnamed protein product [Acanthocheilonema viteae]|uniref:Uncharacterized protein n=1 Tax=Acanthocheilonema viteae TaxID=6277 RepID=A0A498SK16_ACAVI|nr:unnamed protein product [Acanthocheilonema viteae]